MKELTQQECYQVAGGVDYFTWSQYGLAIGATFGVLHAFRGPMTGAALAFKPFEMVLHGAAGAAIGTAGGVAAGFLYQAGVNIYAACQKSAEVGVSLLITAAIAAV